MAEIENLSIIIDVVGDYERELNQLLFKLGQVEAASRAVDPIEIDVEVDRKPVAEMNRLLGQMQDKDLPDFGDMVIGDKRVSRRSGGGGTSARTIRRGMNEFIEGLDEGALAGLFPDDFGRNISHTADAIEDTSEAAKEAAEGFSLTDIRMTDLHNALARLVPMLVVFIGALPALIGGVLALAGAAIAAAVALGSLTAFAGLGAAIQRGGVDNIGEGLMDMFNELQDDFLDAFRPLSQRLAPVFEDAIDGLGRLFQLIANEGDALMTLTDDARAFGRFVVDTLPQFLADMALFVDAAGEALAIMTEGLTGFDFFDALAGVIADVLPDMVVFGKLVADLLPVIFRLSIGFLRATNGLLALFSAFGRVLTILPITDETFGMLVGSMLAAWSITLLLNTALVRMAGVALVAAGKAVLGLIQAFTSYDVAATIATIGSYSFSAALATVAAVGLFALGVFGLLAVAIGGIGVQFLDTSTKIDQATESLKAFQRQAKSARGRNPYADPDLARGEGRGRSRFADSPSVTTVIEGDADTDTIRTQGNNQMYRLERTRRR